MIKNKHLKSFVIVGGGTSGWVMASVLSRLFDGSDNSNISISLIESPAIGAIGVGEATVPSFIDLLSFLGIPGKDFIENTNATFKLGIKFENWQADGKSYWHPFGHTGTNLNGTDFFQFWLKTFLNDDQKHTYTDFSPSAVVGELSNFALPGSDQQTNQQDSQLSVLQNLGYALHFDAGLAAEFLAKYAIANGVKHIPAKIKEVGVSEEGFIEYVQLDNDQVIEGDMFFDCSGQRAILMEKALNIQYEDWQSYLPVDKAAVVQTQNVEDFPPYTQAIAHEHGWRWRIPLRNRTGNGYVFSSKYCDDKSAIELLLKNAKGSPINEPRIISFKTGVREKFWHKNCIAIGLSSGFLEPLESTGIYLIARSALYFAQMLPDASFSEATQNEYNRLMRLEYESLRDFIVIHYCTSNRADTEFWRDWQSREIPDSLENKLTLYKSQGRLMQNETDLFKENSWHSVLTGMGVIPEGYDPIVDNVDYLALISSLGNMEKSIQAAARQQIPHKEFLDKLLAS